MILQEKLRPYRLLLASHSPRRQQLLRDCGLDYTLIPNRSPQTTSS